MLCIGLMSKSLNYGATILSNKPYNISVEDKFEIFNTQCKPLHLNTILVYTEYDNHLW